LAKNPEDYKDAQGLYHVQVALRMNKASNLAKKFKNGDTVSYLFCTDGLPHHLAELSNSKKTEPKDETDITDVKEEENLQPDPEYYLSQQVHPVVSRICEPIPGLDGARIAEALGTELYIECLSYKRIYFP
jgi:DNA polymerase alpha subunit A